MKTYTTEEFLSEVLNCKDRDQASILSDRFMPKDSSTVESSYVPAVNSSWELFYALVCMEKKFQLNHSASTIAVMDLLKPRISLVWSKKEKLPTAEVGDYLQNLFIFISTTGMNKWDPLINDNFCAYISPELQTVVNETVKPEINKYLKKTRGYSSVSSDELNEKLEGGFDAVDEGASVESQVMRSVERKKLSTLGKAIILGEKDKTTTESQRSLVSRIDEFIGNSVSRNLLSKISPIVQEIADETDRTFNEVLDEYIALKSDAAISSGSKNQVKNALFAEGLFDGVSEMSDDVCEAFEDILEMNI